MEMDEPNDTSNNHSISEPKPKRILSKFAQKLLSSGRIPKPTLGAGIHGRNGRGGEFVDLGNISDKPKTINEADKWFNEKKQISELSNDQKDSKSVKTPEALKNLGSNAKRQSNHKNYSEHQKSVLEQLSKKTLQALKERQGFYNAENEICVDDEDDEEEEFSDEEGEEKILDEANEEEEVQDEDAEEINEEEEEDDQEKMDESSIPMQEEDSLQSLPENEETPLPTGKKCIVSDDEGDSLRKEDFESEPEESGVEDEEDPFKVKAKKKKNLVIDTEKIEEDFEPTQDDDEESISTPILPSQFDLFGDLSHGMNEPNSDCDFILNKMYPTTSQNLQPGTFSGNTQDIEDALELCSGTFDSDGASCDEEVQNVEKGIFNEDEANEYRYNLDEDTDHQAYYDEEDDATLGGKDDDSSHSIIAPPAKRPKSNLELIEEQAEESGDDPLSDDEDEDDMAENVYEQEDGDYDNLPDEEVIHNDIIQQDLKRARDEADRDMLLLENRCLEEGYKKSGDISFRTRMRGNDEKIVDWTKHIGPVEDDEEDPDEEVNENNAQKSNRKIDFLKWRAEQELLNKKEDSMEIFGETTIATMETTTTIMTSLREGINDDHDDDILKKEPKEEIRKRYSLIGKGNKRN